MKRKKIKIFFTDFWSKSFDPENNFFTNILKQRFNIEIDPEKPDILVFSLYGKNFLKYNSLRVLFIGENIRPNFLYADFSISFDYNTYNGRNIRLPLYVLYGEKEMLIKDEHWADRIINQNRKFANFLVSNPNAKERIIFFKKLSKYKHVDSGGKVLNNIGFRVKDRFEFNRQYKFTIAFENSSYPGYTTEKLIQPVKSGSIPIYWGNPLVHLEFNPRSFINVMNFKNFDHAIEYIKEVDSNPSLYKKILQEPFFYGNTPNIYYEQQRLLDFFDMIVYNIERGYKPVAQRNVKKLYPILNLRRKFYYYVLKKNLWNI